MHNHSSIKVIPLGGLGEIGKNMLLIEFEDEILVVDAGFYFGASDLPGLDIGIPDVRYLIENQEKILIRLSDNRHYFAKIIAYYKFKKLLNQKH